METGRADGGAGGFIGLPWNDWARVWPVHQEVIWMNAATGIWLGIMAVIFAGFLFTRLKKKA